MQASVIYVISLVSDNNEITNERPKSKEMQRPRERYRAGKVDEV